MRCPECKSDGISALNKQNSSYNKPAICKSCGRAFYIRNITTVIFDVIGYLGMTYFLIFFLLNYDLIKLIYALSIFFGLSVIKLL